MGRLKDTYLLAEGWLELGESREAELALQQLPARARATKRGLTLWLQLSLALERWPEVEAAARELRQFSPADTSPLLHEAEALHQQDQPLPALALLAVNAGRFTGPAWTDYLTTLRKYATRADLPAQSAELLHSILTTGHPAYLAGLCNRKNFELPTAGNVT